MISDTAIAKQNKSKVKQNGHSTERALVLLLVLDMYRCQGMRGCQDKTKSFDMFSVAGCRRSHPWTKPSFASQSGSSSIRGPMTLGFAERAAAVHMPATLSISV